MMEDFVSAPWLRRLITATLLAGLVLLGFRVMEPFIVPVVWAAILAFVTWSTYLRLLRACGGRRVLASLLMTIAVSLAVIDRKSTRLNSSHSGESRMPSSA